MTLIAALDNRRPKLSPTASAWSALAVLNGLAFAMPASRFAGFSSAVLMVLVAAANVMTYLVLAGGRIRVSARDMRWIKLFVLVAGYLTARTAVAVMFEAPAPVGGFDLASGLREWRGDLSALLYAGSLWLVVCGSGRQFRLKGFIRAWFAANFVYWAWTAAFGARSTVFRWFDAPPPTGRLALLGYEPSYTGPMLIILALLLLAQKPVRKLDWLIVFVAIAGFFGVFSKAAIVALVVAIAITLLVNLGALRTVVVRHYVISIVLIITMVAMAGITFTGDLAASLKSNVITPLILGPDAATGYAMSGEAGSFDTRYLAMANALHAVWPSHALFGFGQGIYHFALAHTAFRTGYVSAELSGYVTTTLGAFTAKSDMLNMLLSGGLVGLLGMWALLLRSFRFAKGITVTELVCTHRYLLFAFLAASLLLTERLPFWSIFVMVNVTPLYRDAQTTLNGE